MQCVLPVIAVPSGMSADDSGKGSGVARYVSADRKQAADVYLGLQLDGDKSYENVNDVDPNIKFQFSSPPTINCDAAVIDYDPGENRDISITVRLFIYLRKFTYLLIAYKMQQPHKNKAQKRTR